MVDKKIYSPFIKDITSSNLYIYVIVNRSIDYFFLYFLLNLLRTNLDFIAWIDERVRWLCKALGLSKDFKF